MLSEVRSKKTGDLREAMWRPPIAVKPIDSKRAVIGFLRPSQRNPGFERHSGQFLDLHTLVRALTDESHSLKSAGETFKSKIIKADADEHGKITPRYIEYARRDVAATASLFEAVMADYLQDPIDLQPTRAFSAASRGKAHMRAMNIQPVLDRQPDFPPVVLGSVMTAYFGGRAEAHIRRVPDPGVPVTYLDFASMYPTVNVLMDLWHVMTAAEVEIVEDDPSKLRAWIDRRTVVDMFDPAIWPELRVFVQIKPNADVLPVRAAYGAGHDFNIALNYYSSDEPQWFALPDVIASKLMTGRSPEVVRAIRLMPVGRQAGMCPITLRGGIEFDPYTADFFRVLVEQRNRLPDKNSSTGRGLKTTGNGTGYGMWAEMNRVEQPGGRKLPVIVHGQRTFECKTAHPEKPGPYYFPPVAALIASAARLMLALLETLVTQAGGTWAFCDTDSMAIVATEHGRLIPCPGGPERDERGRECVRALSWAQVDESVRRFEALNPYDREAVRGSILETEKVNYDSAGNRRQLWTFPISAKRYPLYTLKDGHPSLVRVIDLDDDENRPSDEPDQLDELADAKQHGLGHLLNPLDPKDESRDWIKDEWWDYIVRTDALGQQAAERYWLDRPAIGRFNVSTTCWYAPSSTSTKASPTGGRSARSTSCLSHTRARWTAGADKPVPARHTVTNRSEQVDAAPVDQRPRLSHLQHRLWKASYPRVNCRRRQHLPRRTRRLPHPPRGEIARTRWTALRQADGRTARAPPRHADTAPPPPRQGGKPDRRAGGTRRRPRRDPHRVPRARQRPALAAHRPRAPRTACRADGGRRGSIDPHRGASPRRQTHRHHRTRQASPRQSRRPRGQARPRSAPRGRHPPAARPRGATRRLPTPRGQARARAGRRADAHLPRMRPANHETRASRAGTRVVLRRLSQAWRASARRPRLNRHAHYRPHPARPLAVGLLLIDRRGSVPRRIRWW